MYSFYLIFLASISSISAIKASTTNFDIANPKESINSICNSSFKIQNDYCKFFILTTNKEGKEIDFDSKIDVCSDISTKSLNYQCITQLAQDQEDVSICSKARSRYYINYCKKTYNFRKELEAWIGKFTKRTKPELSGSLKMGKFNLGFQDGEYNVFPRTNVYDNGDVLVAEFIDVSGFKKGSDGLNHYDVGLIIWQGNNTVKESWGVLDNEKDDLDDGLLQKTSIISKLKNIKPGNYTYEFIIYDLVFKRSARMNKSIEVVNKFKKSDLMLNEFYNGISAGSDCIEKNSTIYSNQDILCTYVDISGFEKDVDGLNWIDVDVETRTKNNSLISVSKNIYGDDGRFELIVNTYSGILITSKLKYLGNGNYSQTITIKDRVGKKSVSFKRNMTVVNQDYFGYLKIPKVIVGVEINSETVPLCKESADFSLDRNVKLCFEPLNVKLKEEDELYWFDLSLTIKNSRGDVVEQIDMPYGAEGHTYLIDGKLNDYWLLSEVSNLGVGRFEYNMTVYDLISGKKGYYTGTFEIK